MYSYSNQYFLITVRLSARLAFDPSEFQPADDQYAQAECQYQYFNQKFNMKGGAVSDLYMKLVANGN